MEVREDRAGSDSPAQLRPPGFLSLFSDCPPDFLGHFCPGTRLCQSVSICVSRAGVSATVRGSFHLVSSSPSPLGYGWAVRSAPLPLYYYWWRGGGKAVSSPPMSILLVAGTERRAGGGSGQEAGGAAGAEPRAPGGRIVFLRGSAAGVGAPTRTQDSRNPTAPWSLNPSTIQTGGSSHLARTPNTDCELCAARSWGLPAAPWISLTRISEQVPWDQRAPIPLHPPQDPPPQSQRMAAPHRMPRAPHPMPLLLLLWLSLPHAQAAFPQDPIPLVTSDLQGSSPLSWFRGLEEDAVAAELGLDFQRFLTLNRTLLVAARDHVFSFDLQAQEEGEGLVPNKFLTWRSQDVENCAVRGKLTDECYNYIRVLVPWDSQRLLACGTNSFSPMCRSYGITSLQQEGEELSGQARCPFDATQSNVAIFAEGSLYSATAADFQASDAVVYRSLGSQPPLRSAKYDSKWLREPHFVYALEHRDHVYFFFREVAVEDSRLGRVQFSRVARVCKRDMGGSPRALDRHWTSFLKLRLNCSVPGDSTFYFDVLQALTGPVNLHGRSALFGVFTTQTNSIPGSAVCAFYLDDIERGFEGKFKEQRSLDGAWTPVSEDRVPSPRPGSCAGVGGAASFSSSQDLPDAVLLFIKAHPLLDPAVPPATHQPLLTLTSRALLTQVAVDGVAGPHRNTTVLFLGSNDGTVLKVLPPGGQSLRPEPIILEEIDAYSPARCSGKRSAQASRRIIGLELDTEGHRLFVAFPGCIVYLPLSRCARHGACQRSCLASQDPYCGWHRLRGCVSIRGPGGTDVDVTGNQESTEHGDCQDGATGSQSGPGDSAYVHLGPGPSLETPSSPSDAHPGPQSSTLGAHTQGVRRDLSPASASRSIPIPLLLACVAAAFALGASVSGFLVSCACRRARRRRSKDIESPGLPRPLSLRSLARLHGGGSEPPPPPKDGDAAQTPQLYTTFLPPPDGGPPPDLACLPTPESTPELPVKHLRASGGPWEWNQNGNNASEGPGRPAGCSAAGGPAPRVLVRPPPPGCPGQAVEVTTLEELLRYLHGPQPPRKGAEPLAPAAFSSRPPAPAPSPLPRDCVPPLRLDVPPEGKRAAPGGRPALSAPAPRLGVGRRLPFPTHRAPPALLTRVPSGGPARYSGGPGRHLLYLGRPDGYRGRSLKRADAKSPLTPKPPLAASTPPAPHGGHFNF